MSRILAIKKSKRLMRSFIRAQAERINKHMRRLSDDSEDAISTDSSIITNLERLKELDQISKSEVSNERRSHKKKIKEYIVQDILELEHIDYKPHFFIKWKYYPQSENTWEPIENLSNCQDIVADFLQKKIISNADDIRKIAPRIQSTITESDAFQMLKENNLYDVISRFLIYIQLDKLQLISHDKLESILSDLQLLPYAVRRAEQQQRLREWERMINDEEPICELAVENDIDFEGPPENFTYVSKPVYGKGVEQPSAVLYGCECPNGCNSLSNCCGKKEDSMFAYTLTGRVKVTTGTPIYECNELCTCGINCPNRPVQRGSNLKITIFKTMSRGWGIKTRSTIFRGQFITTYIGELITMEEASERNVEYEKKNLQYMFDLDFYDNSLYTMDATRKGNFARFINHSCSPNCGVWSVWTNNLNPHIFNISLFALRKIEIGEEITFDYLNQLESSFDLKMECDLNNTATSNKGVSAGMRSNEKTVCSCGAENCRKSIF